MCRLFETIKINQGVLHNISLHNERFNRSRQELFGIKEALQLENEIHLPENIGNDIYKCRIIYSRNIEKIEITPYRIPKITSLKIINDNSIQYQYKYENRDNIKRLYSLKDQCDDILIVRNGLITDTSYCNIVFSDGNKLITPSTPLLKGTKREQLLRDGVIMEDEIKQRDIYLFKKAFLVNAMIDLEDNVAVLTDEIIFD